MKLPSRGIPYLQVDERVVTLLRELDVPENGCDNVRSDLGRLLADGHGDQRVRLQRPVHRHRLLAEVDAQGAGDPLDAQEVVAVGGDVDLVD